jgi:hypothetical protein
MHSGQFISSLSPSIVFDLISSALIWETVPQAQFGQVARTSYRFFFAMALSLSTEVHRSTRLSSRSVLHEKPPQALHWGSLPSSSRCSCSRAQALHR